MFQYTWFDKKIYNDIQIPALPNEYINITDIDKIAPLYWAEHCVECAVPLCYNNCINWEERIDKKCRRFAYGIKRTKTNCNYSSTLKFKKWGKLESAFYSKKFITSDKAIFLDKLNYLTSNLVKKISNILKFISPKYKLSGAFEVFKNIYLKKIGKPEKLCKFLFTSYLHEKNSCDLFFEILNSEGMYEKKKLKLNPGFNQIYFDINNINIPDNVRLRIYGSESMCCEITIYFADFVVLNNSGIMKLLPQRKEKSSKIKCVVWDLDNTIWDGILIESNPEHLTLKENVLDTIKWLDDRGIIQCIASKNYENDAVNVLKNLGIYEYFVDFSINWEQKSLNIFKMAKNLNININTFAFIDDSAFERAEVGNLLPCVRIFDETQIKTFKNLDEFNVPITTEAKQRRKMYQTEYRRKTDQLNKQLSQTDFLISCNLKAQICHIDSDDKLKRGYELLQRTNQLNLSGHRYNEDEFSNIVNNNYENVYTLYLSDKFGEYGQALVLIVENTETDIVIKDLAISCRIAGKYVESALFNWLSIKYGQKNIRLIGFNSKKNSLLIETLINIGFIRITDDNDDKLILYKPAYKELFNTDIVKVNYKN